PDAIDIETGGTKLEFRRPEQDQPWQLYRDGKLQKSDDAEVKVLVGLLTQKDQVKKFLDPKEAKKRGLDPDRKADVTVSVYADSLEKADREKEGKKGDKKKDKKEDKKSDKV